MKKTYEVKIKFWIGELNKELKEGRIIEYDAELGKLYLDDGVYEAKNLKAAIKAEWIVPTDGDYPELDGPIGETQVEAAERRRKERFAEMENENRPKIIKDEQDIGVVVGVVGEENTEEFNKALGVDITSKKVKFTQKVIEDDTRVVKKGMPKDKEVEQMKIALGQNKQKTKKSPSQYELTLDHIDGGFVEIGKYTSTEGELKVGLASKDDKILKNWSNLHWTAKANSIKKANKLLLSEIEKVEKSPKILKRIKERLATI